MSIKELFKKSKNASHKFDGYFEIYEKNFSSYKNKKIVFVEIGILNGGSLSVWREYFGPKSRIIGIDLNPECKKFEEDGVEVFIGNQSDPIFWDNFFKKVGNVDIILDDGGHTNLDQIITTIKTVERINNGGILMIEDTHTSYYNVYNSKKSFSFINYAKKIVDDVNSRVVNVGKFNFSLRNMIYSTSFYTSIVVFNIDREKCTASEEFKNDGTNHDVKNFAWIGNEIHVKKFKKIFSNFNFISLRKITKFIKNRIHNKILENFFK